MNFLASALAVRLGKEINPKFKIGTMISHVPIYPYSCHPKDMMEAQIANRLRFFFPDVQVRGYYPSYAKKMLARKGYDVDGKKGTTVFYSRARLIILALVITCLRL